MNRSTFLGIAGGALTMCGLPVGAEAAESDISLATATGTLYGTLTTPAGAGPFAAVLIIAGSGPTDRNGNNPGLPGKDDTYKLLASALAANGLASVRYDKRGIGASAAAAPAGGEAALRFDTFADDAAAWLQMIHADRRFSRAIIAGHSEGSLLGMLAAQRAPAAAYVSLEGPGRPAPAVLREQLKPKLPPAMYAQADAIISSLQAGKTVPYDNSSPLAALFRESIQPYLISWFKYDPSVEIGKLQIPVTIVQGTADVQVFVEDAQDLQKGNPRAKLVIVQGMNHVLKHAPDTSTQSAILAGYSNPDLPVEPQVVQAVASAAA